MITDKIIIYRKVIDDLYPLYMKKYHETELDESEITIIMCSLKIRISNLDSIQWLYFARNCKWWNRKYTKNHQ